MSLEDVSIEEFIPCYKWLIMYALLDDVVDEFIPNMKTMELEVDSIDDLVLVLRQTDQADMLRENRTSS